MSFSLALDRLLSLLAAQAIVPQVLTDTDPVDPLVLTGLSTDSRSLTQGQGFVALRGERFDGHQFLAIAQEQGATLALVDGQFQPTPGDLTLGLTLVQVDNTLRAYQAIAHWWRQQFQIPVIGVTGSVGKTTTKELIAAMVATQGPVLKTEANYNNEIGVPKTLLQLRTHHRYAVIEMAMRGPGEIAELAAIAAPTLGVITNVGVAHIERLGSREAIAAAKCELLTEMAKSKPGLAPGLAPESAINLSATNLSATNLSATNLSATNLGEPIAILNQDNPLLMATAQGCWPGKTITFGLEGGQVQGQLRDLETLAVGDHVFQLPLAGEHNALNFLAALAVADCVGVPRSALTQLQVTLPGGRAKRLNWDQDIVALDETYNAGPESMAAALVLLSQIPGQRHLAVLGTMKELGEKSLGFHRDIGQRVQSLGLDRLLVLADPGEAQALADGAGSVPTEQFTDPAQLVQRLKEVVQPGDRLLFKASRSVALDQVVTQLAQHFNPSGNL